jgi:hypothetical protein
VVLKPTPDINLTIFIFIVYILSFRGEVVKGGGMESFAGERGGIT